MKFELSIGDNLLSPKKLSEELSQYQKDFLSDTVNYRNFLEESLSFLIEFKEIVTVTGIYGLQIEILIDLIKDSIDEVFTNIHLLRVKKLSDPRCVIYINKIKANRILSSNYIYVSEKIIRKNINYVN